MGARRPPLFQAGKVVGDLSRRCDLPPRTTRAAHRHLGIGISALVEFTVGGFNSRWGISRFGANANRRYDVLAVIEKLDADILVLPETWVPHVGTGIVDELRDRGYEVAVDRWVTLKHGVRSTRLSSPGDAWWSLAVASRLPVVGRRDLPLPRTIADPASPRVAIQLSVDVGGVVVDAVGLHTSSRLWWGAPLVHLNGLRKQLRPPERPAFLAGDFNLWGPGVERLLPGWRRTVLGRTYPSHRPHSQIDHILVNEKLTCMSAEVIDDRRSDHRPVRARLRA